jgi:hypothetical protein
MIDGIMVVSPKKVKFEPKDGDVVVCDDGGIQIFICKENLGGSIYYYCMYNTEDNDLTFYENTSYMINRYATEEEKKKLFDKLAEEGWEWKPDTKELVKLKWKPKKGEPYFSPIFSNIDFLFSTCSSIYTGHFTDEMTIKKMRAFRTKEECQLFCDKLNETIEEYEA